MTKSEAAVQTKHYLPHGGADMLWRCRSSEILYDGPAGTGKTRAVLEKVLIAACKYDKARILICRKTRASMTQSALVTFEDKVCGVEDGHNWPWITNTNRIQRESYNFPNGSVIVVGGLDKPGRILSTEYDMIIVHQAEEITEDDWETLLTRLRNNVMPYQQAIAECNPSYPMHWLKARADRGDMRRIVSRHEDNPSITDDYLQRLSKLSGHRRERLYKGQWAAAEGRVYDLFDDGVHIREKQGPFSRAIIGVDEGYSNPCSLHLYLVDSDGRVHAKREFHRTRQLAAPIIEWIKKRVRSVRRAYGLDVEAVIVDPSASKLIAELEENDLPVLLADNDVDNGIKNVLEFLADPGDGQPRFTMSAKCCKMHMEFNSYLWARNAAGQQKDKPQKENDHAMDELRYSLAYVTSTAGDMEVVSL